MEWYFVAAGTPHFAPFFLGYFALDEYADSIISCLDALLSTDRQARIGQDVFAGSTPTAPFAKWAIQVGTLDVPNGLSMYGFLDPTVQAVLKERARAAGIEVQDSPPAGPSIAPSLAGWLPPGMETLGAGLGIRAPSVPEAVRSGPLPMDTAGVQDPAFSLGLQPKVVGVSTPRGSYGDATMSGHGPGAAHSPRVSYDDVVSAANRASMATSPRASGGSFDTVPAHDSWTAVNRGYKSSFYQPEPKSQSSGGFPAPAPPSGRRASPLSQADAAAAAQERTSAGSSDLAGGYHPMARHSSVPLSSPRVGGSGRGWTAFTAFGLKMRDAVRAEHPWATATEVEKLLGQRWSRLTAAEKQVYAEVAARVRRQHDEGPAAPDADLGGAAQASSLKRSRSDAVAMAHAHLDAGGRPHRASRPPSRYTEPGEAGSQEQGFPPHGGHESIVVLPGSAALRQSSKEWFFGVGWETLRVALC